MDQRPFSDGMGPRQTGDGFGPSGGRDGFRRSGLLESPGGMYPDEYTSSPSGGGLMNRPVDKPLERPGLMGAAPESGSLPNKLLTYLVCCFSHKVLPKLRKKKVELLRASHNFCHLKLFHQDTFRIENEDDAQLVLKVTQKLTDVLMEYRLRSVSAVWCRILLETAFQFSCLVL